MLLIDITKDYLELFTAKRDIENMLIEKEEIEEPMELSEFIRYINFGTHIYWESETEIFPFKIINTPDNMYVFIVSDENTAKKQNILLSVLNDIQFDFTKLYKKDRLTIANEDIMLKPHFIINNELYYIEK